MNKQLPLAPSTLPQTRSLTRRVRATGLLIIAVLVYCILLGGELLASYRLDTLQEQASLRYKQAFDIEAKRFRSEDLNQIHVAAAQGYEQNLFLSSFDRGIFLALAHQYQIAPLAPQPNSRLYYCNEGYGLIRYESDRFGFRNEDSLWATPEVDAVLIGDSFAHGACVELADSIAGQIQKNRDGSVLNLATGGNGPIHYAAVAKTFLPVTKPKYAIFFFFPNDNLDETNSIYRKIFFNGKPPEYFQIQSGQRVPTGVSSSLQQLYSEARRHLRVPAKNAVLTPAPIKSQRPPPDTSFFEKVKGALVLRDLRSILASTIAPWLPASPPPWSTRLAIDTALTTCRQIGCKPIFVYLPNSDFWSPDYRAESYRRSIDSYIAEQALTTKLVDLTDTINSMGMNAFAPSGKHYSKQAYKRVAQVVQEAMLDNGSSH